MTIHLPARALVPLVKDFTRTRYFYAIGVVCLLLLTQQTGVISFSTGMLHQHAPSQGNFLFQSSNTFTALADTDLVGADTVKTDSLKKDTPVEALPLEIPDTTEDESVAPEDSVEEEPEVEPETEAGEPDSLVQEDSLKIPKSLLHDSLRVASDSTSSDSTKNDSTYVVFLDSTWRMQQHTHHRRDDVAVNLFARYNSSLYLDVVSPAYVREISMDTLGRFVTIREQVNGVDVKVPITLTTEEYIRQRLEFEKLNNWRTMTYEYNLNKGDDGLGGLFSSFTNIEIPVPQNPIFSIFGKNKISLRITGAIDIRAGFRNVTSDLQTLASTDQSRNEPDFKQDVSINVDGSVGDKLKINADWNTQRTFEFENSLKIRYQGYDDDIIKTIEAGNVSLSVPSFVGSSQALFGIKSEMQFGPLKLTALVSQKKGSAKEVSVSGGSKAVGKDISPLRYSLSHFFVDTVYRKIFEEFHRVYPPQITSEMQQLEISEIEVWKAPTNAQVQGRKQARAYINLPPKIDRNETYDEDILSTLDSTVGSYYSGFFVRLEPNKDYKIHPVEGFISLNSAPNDNEIIAVSYSTIGGQSRYFGEFAGNDTNSTRPIVLKLIKPENLTESYYPAWKLQLRNIYSLDARDIKEGGLDLKVYYKPIVGNDIEDPKGVNLLTLLQLDRYRVGGEGPDNLFDFLPNFTIDKERGELIFPNLEPFDSALAEQFEANGVKDYDSLILRGIYNRKLTEQERNSLQSNIYTIRVNVTGAVSARIPLGSFNVVEGSVQVLLNGSPLTAGVDYDVNYIIGEVNVRKEEALVPGANLQVKFEQNDMFQIASKTLMGARGELDLGRDSKFGFTIMNLNQETLSDKVRLGEEPTNNTIMGIDGGTSFNLPFLTSALDAIPGLRAREMSSIKISGEAAYILPDPNTKRSSIQSDNGASIAYIDDFEGSRRTVPLNVNYTAWKPASPPVYTLVGPETMTPLSKMYSKAKMSWFNNTQRYEPVSTQEIWPFKSVRRGQELVPILILDYNPLERGMFNYSLNIDSTLKMYPERNWNGVQRYINSTAGDLTQQNIAYLEMWFRATSEDSLDLRKGRLYVDIGKVSEDVVPNGKLNSEDAVITEQNLAGLPNGVLNPGEDIGLDTLSDVQERARYSEFITRNPQYADDPSGDNFDYTTESNSFERINGTERNGERNSVDGRYPDTEDLNGNGTADVTDTYIEYEIPLAESLEDGSKNIAIVGGGTNKWFQVRIPLQDSTRIVGGQSVVSILQNVQYIRLWLSGYKAPVRLRIAEISFVGNQWLETMRDDSVMKVSVVNIEDNSGAPDFYTIPPGVIRERDRTQPDQEIFGNEQSLAMLINGLRAGETRQVAKYFSQRPIDMFNYRSLKVFVHGDQSFGEDAEIFLRFGADTLNYYEYRQPLTSEWGEMNVVFSELTSVKAARDSGANASQIPAPSGPPGSFYAIRGNPALTKVQYLGIGVRNISGRYPHKTRYTNPPRELFGKVWVNEMRVTEVDNSAGGAYRFDTQIKLADFGNVSVNYSYTDPNYHGVDRAFGDRVTRKNWAVNTNFALDHFLPQDWKTSLPIAYSHQENIALPKYLPNTDVVVDEAARRAGERTSADATPEEKLAASERIITESQTLSVRDNFSVSGFKFGLPFEAWYIRDIINSITLRFNYASSSQRDPSIVSATSWQWNFGMNYDVTLNHSLFLQPFSSLFNGIYLLEDYKDWKIYLFPIMGFRSSLDGGRSLNSSLSRTQNSAVRETRTFNASKQLSFGWKITEGGLLGIGGDYVINIKRDLLYLDTTGTQSFSQVLHALFFGGRDGSYGQNITFNLKPKIPNIFNITKYLDQINVGYRVNYAWQNAFQRGDLGKSAAWENSISAGFNFRLKSLADGWFKDDDAPAQSKQQQPPRIQQREMRVDPNDSTKRIPADSAAVEDTSASINPLEKLKYFAKILIKYPLLDYENINISFGQSNRSANNGVIGSTGFKNFWGTLPFQMPDADTNGGGPSRLYQLGLVSDPSSTLRWTGSFPFFEPIAYRGPDGWVSNSLGLRAKNGRLTNDFSQKNDIALKTNRPLWEGASLEINWKVGWQYRRTTNLSTDSILGLPIEGSTKTGGTVERSYMSLPPILLFKVFKSNLEDVGKKYEANIKSPEYTNKPGAAAADAFEKGMEALPFLNKFLGQFVPRANWSLRWSGVEKITGISDWVQSMSLDHSYRSSFRRDFHIADDGSEQTDVERISYDFAPLIGLQTTFKEVWKGNLGGNFQYKTSTAYDLSLTNQKITEDVTSEMSLSLNYSRRGFEFPLFGLNLKNDLEFSFTYSRALKTRRQHDPAFLQTNQEGTPLDGNIRTTMEPRIRYTLSARVTASLFYRYSRTAPDEGGSTIPGTTTNEAGVDIHISIQ
ncbi:MAG: cell surface protein SprA [Ignavibacteriae bacterium]|nr:cell surface protein SprA [Ignavibacteriota bacterium]